MYNNKILGAIVGDIVGSTREWNNVKTEDFELLPAGSRFTDDTVMTLAVAEWLMTDSEHSERGLVECMQRLGRKYPNAGYGGMFRRWLATDNPQPYNSFGNGSAMRVSPVGLYANSMEEALEFARITASVSHNHPEGIKGAQAIAAAIYLKRTEEFDTKGEIKRFIEKHFGYNLDTDLREIRKDYAFDVTCQGSVPIAIMAYLQEPYRAENAIRLAVSMGGDSDTIGAMAASIATAERPHTISSSSLSSEIEEQCRKLLPPDLLDINDRFLAFINRPLNQSYEVSGNGIIYAGEYPGDKEKKVVGKDDVVITHFKKDAHDDEEIITFKNNTDSKINRIEGIIVYKDMSGNDISYNELNLKISIAPGMSKQTKISSFDQDNKYSYYKDFQSYMESVGVRPFKYEFRLISYK